MMKILVAVLTTVLVCLCAIAATAFWSWSDLNTPVAVKPGLEIEIPAGSSPEETIARLSAAGIIKHTLPLKMYLKATHAGSKFKAGVYSFPNEVSPLAVLKILESGGKPFGKLTVIEGWTRWDIAQALLQAGSLGLKNKEQALKLLNNAKLINDLDKGAKNLEGYLYPDTYFFDSKTRAQDLVAQMVARFHQVWGEKLQPLASAAKVTPHDIVTVASLIETEAKLKQEQPLVAAVIYNRIGQGKELAVDCSLVYAAKLANAWKYDGKVYQSDIDRKSPYNTRQNKGLPPGPIGSPGLGAMMAALKPAHVDYIYYVRNPARNDGAQNFYNNPADFEKGVQALRDWEKQRDNANANKAKAQASSSSPATGRFGSVLQARLKSIHKS